MKKFFSFFNFGNFRESTTRALTRFPIAVAILVGIATLFFSLLHGKFDTTTESMLTRMILSGVVTFFLSLGVSLGSESMDQSRLRGYILQALPVAFGALYYQGFSTDLGTTWNIVYFLLTFTGIIAILFVAPYLRKLFSKEASQESYYTFFYSVGTIFLISAILWGVLALLGNIAIWTVITLFDLRGVVTDKLFGDWMIIASSLLAPFFALTKLPARDTFESGHFNENAFFSFLVKYIAIPFIFLYFVILYAYSVKVLMNFSEWPKGEVSWMVIGFSLFGYIIYIFSYIFEGSNRAIRYFRASFPAIVLPQLAMLGYAIYLRINQYDLTMNRYFVVVFGIWLLIICVYLLVSKRKYLANIPAILALFTLLVSIGPWSVYNLPMDRQLKRLESNLVKAHILQNGKIVPLKHYDDISADLSKEIYYGIDYMCGFDNCQVIKDIFPDQYSKIETDMRTEFEKNRMDDLKRAQSEKEKEEINNRVFDEPRKWNITMKITEAIKVKMYFWSSENEFGPVVYFSLSDDDRVFPLDLKWYRLMHEINYINLDEKEKLFVLYNPANASLEFKKAGKIVDSVLLDSFQQTLLDGYKTSKHTSLPLSAMTFDTEKYRILFTSLSVKNPNYKEKEDGTYGAYSAQGYVLEK